MGRGTAPTCPGWVEQRRSPQCPGTRRLFLSAWTSPGSFACATAATRTGAQSGGRGHHSLEYVGTGTSGGRTATGGNAHYRGTTCPSFSDGLGTHQPDGRLCLGFNGEKPICAPGLAYTFPGCSSALQA